MKLTWNCLGILGWFILLIDLFFTVKHLYQHKLWHRNHWKTAKHHSKSFLMKLLLLMILLLGLTYAKCDYISNGAQTNKTIDFKPLALGIDNNKTYYVYVHNYGIVKNYIFFADGIKKHTTSKQTLLLDHENTNLQSNYIGLNASKFHNLDSKYQKAWVEIITNHYKNKWQNGLGLHVGRTVHKHIIIRVPNHNYVKNN